MLVQRLKISGRCFARSIAGISRQCVAQTALTLATGPQVIPVAAAWVTRALTADVISSSVAGRRRFRWPSMACARLVDDNPAGNVSEGFQRASATSAEAIKLGELVVEGWFCGLRASSVDIFCLRKW